MTAISIPVQNRTEKLRRREKMWLDRQTPGVLRQWLKATNVPMLATRPDGAILWANQAYEDLVGYASTELVGVRTWIELTSGAADSEGDAKMAELIASGERTEYSFRKAYLHKTQQPRPVRIHVLRYPAHGPFEFFLVSVLPLDADVSVLEEVESIQVRLVELMSQNRNSLEHVTELAKAHPIVATVIAAVLSTLLFGDRVLELAGRAIGLIGGGN